MSSWLIAGLTGATALSLGGAAAASIAAPPGQTALARVETGNWHFTHGDGGTRDLCVADASRLLQLRHAGQQCVRMDLGSDQEQAVVHYTCPGTGYGRTTIRVETPRLIHVETQGVANGAPFQFDMEGRRTGPCRGTR